MYWFPLVIFLLLLFKFIFFIVILAFSLFTMYITIFSINLKWYHGVCFCITTNITTTSNFFSCPPNLNCLTIDFFSIYTVMVFNHNHYDCFYLYFIVISVIYIFFTCCYHCCNSIMLLFFYFMMFKESKSLNGNISLLV